jgi:hypothetical protein
MRRCLLKGCEQRFHPRLADQIQLSLGHASLTTTER